MFGCSSHAPKRGLVVGLLSVVAITGTAGQSLPAQAEGTKAPSDVLHDVRAAIATAPPEKQREIAEPLLALARRRELSPLEDIALGDLHFLALQGGPAAAIYARYLDRTDRLGRIAWQRHQQILFRGRNLHDEAERNIPEFRKRFRPSADDLTYTGGMIANQAVRYADKGDHAKVVALILEDVAVLPRDLPLRSFRLLGTRYASFLAVGKGQEARALLQAHRTALQERIAKGGPELVAASELLKQPFTHRAGVLHADFDTLLADDAPGYEPERFATQLAIDRVKEIEDLLAKMSREDGPPRSNR